GVVGIGEPLARAVGASIAGLRAFPALAGPGVEVPGIAHALWVHLHGDDRGALFDLEVQVMGMLADDFMLADAVDMFLYRGGRDLSGFEDGTENPKGDDAIAAAIVTVGEGMAGSSFVAVQRWLHDLGRYRRMTLPERNAMMGRDLESNDEIEDAPPSAHVKRSAQEDYDPPAFMWRRSMPWAGAGKEGFEFIAYGESLDRFERVMRRMAGLDDGIVDGLFTYSRPVTGAYYWCPPVAAGRLDLRALGL
ncbi:MAG: Dyp-type peroxidase, partial [Betaproteobacteria bacterium]|nr:Dyp-type peroxidase [Betaproteobacteria bacterium]